MNAYFFTGGTTRSQFRLTDIGRGRMTNRSHEWRSCNSLIVWAENAAAARKRFEEWLCTQPEGENPVQTQINRIVAAQFFEQMLTETGFVSMDWTRIAREAQSEQESVPVDDFEQGYWIDVNSVLLPSPNIEALHEDLPEDIRGGLNWAEDKQFIFLLSVLSPPEEEPVTDNPIAQPPPNETCDEAARDQGDPQADFPGLVEKEAAVLIRARNSAVAAWLWRRYAADSKLAAYQIQIDPWCGMVRAEDAYLRLGDAKRANGDLEGAIADYAEAMELNPKCAWAYHARGCLRYDLRAFPDALLDFHKVLELDSFLQDYAHFRIWLIHTRLGAAEAAIIALKTYLVGRTRGKPDDWASKIGCFLAGQVGELEFLAATNNTNQKMEAGQICQAYFYAGSKHLFARDVATATEYFQKTIATDANAYTEYSSAGAELKFLKTQKN